MSQIRVGSPRVLSKALKLRATLWELKDLVPAKQASLFHASMLKKYAVTPVAGMRALVRLALSVAA